MTFPDRLFSADPEADAPVVEFTVRGLPAAQGSVKAFIAGGHAHIATESNRPNTPLGAWRSAIRTEAQAAMGDRLPFAGPVGVTIEFRMPRPKSHFRTNGQLKPNAPRWHTGAPDGDKLLRAALDALTGIVYRDDKQGADLHATKPYSLLPGCHVQAWALE
jgi:Holliday junction resolvase RusA-like endonuclease